MLIICQLIANCFLRGKINHSFPIGKTFWAEKYINGAINIK